MVKLAGGEHRFKTVKTPRDYIMYQSFLDFCWDISRPNIKWPFDKRIIEFQMLDRSGTLNVTKEDIDKFESELKIYAKDLRRVVLADPPSAGETKLKSKAKISGVSRTARGRSENRQRERSPESSNLTKSPVSTEVANLFLKRKSTDLMKPRSGSFN